MLGLDGQGQQRVQFGYGLNYLIDLAHAIVVDVEPTPARSSDEVASTKTMLDRPSGASASSPTSAADTAYGTAKFLDWLIGAASPRISRSGTKATEKTARYRAATFAGIDGEASTSARPAGAAPTGKVHEGYKLRYRASKFDCEVCPLKMQCCPKAPSREVPRDVHEYARDVTRRLMRTKAYLVSRISATRRDALCPLEGSSPLRAHATARSFRRPRRVRPRCHRAKPQDLGAPNSKAATHSAVSVICLRPPPFSQ